MKRNRKRLDSLVCRKDGRMGDMIQVWKILHGHFHVDKIKWFSSAYVPGENERQTRMSSDPLNRKVPVVHTEIRRNFLVQELLIYGMIFPYEIKSAGNMNIFKNKLDNWPMKTEKRCFKLSLP